MTVRHFVSIDKGRNRARNFVLGDTLGATACALYRECVKRMHDNHEPVVSRELFALAETFNAMSDAADSDPSIEPLRESLRRILDHESDEGEAARLEANRPGREYLDGC